MRLLDELDTWEQIGEPLATGDVIAALERLDVSSGDTAGPGRVAAVLRSHARAHPALRHRCSCSAWKRARCRGADVARRSSTTTVAASSAHGSSAPTRPAAIATSSTPRARAPRGGSCSCARRRPAGERRSRRARSGTTPRPVFDPADVAHATKRRPAVAPDTADLTRRRPRADGCERSRRSPDGDSADLARRSPTRTAGRGACAGRASRSTGRPDSAIRSRSRASQPERRSAQRSWSASSTARRPGSSSAAHRSQDDRRRGRRAAARQGRPPGAVHVLQRAAEGARHRARDRGEPRRGARVPPAVPRRCVARRECASSYRRRRVGRAARGPAPRPRARSSVSEARSPLALLPRRFEVRFGTEPLRARELQRGLEIDDGVFVSGTIDRIDLDPAEVHAASSRTTSRARDPFLGPRRSTRRRACRSRSICSCCATSSGIEPLGGVYRALSGSRGARGMLRGRGRADDLPGFAATRLPRRRRVLGRSSTRQSSARASRRDGSASGDVAHDPKGDEGARRGATSGRMCRVSRARA